MLRRGPADPGGRPRRAHLGTGGVWSAAVLWLREGAGSTGRDHRRGPWRTGSGEVCDRGGMMRQSSRPATTSAVNGIRPLRATRVHHVTGTETLGGVEARVVGQGGRADRKRTLTAAFDAQQKSRLRAPPPPRLPQVRGSSTDVVARARLELLRGGGDLVASALGERRSPLERASLGEGDSAQIVGQEFGRDSWRIVQVDASAMREASLEPQVEVVLGCRERGQRTKSRVSMWRTTMLSC